MFSLIFLVRLPLVLGKSVICDRYLYDTVITDLSIDMSYPKKRIKEVLDCLLAILPQPTISFLIDVPENIAYQRKNDIPSKNYLRDRRRIYLDIVEEYEMTLLNGSNRLEDIMLTVQKTLSEYQ